MFSWWWGWLYPRLLRFWGRIFNHSFPACALFFVFFVCLFFEVEISSRTLIPLFRPGSVHSGSASCGGVFLDKLHVCLFLDRFPHYVSPLRLRWVEGVCMIRCNLSPALLAEWPGSFTCHCGSMGWNRHQIRVSTQSWLWRRKFLLRSCWDLNLQPFNQETGALFPCWASSRVKNRLKIHWTPWPTTCWVLLERKSSIHLLVLLLML